MKIFLVCLLFALANGQAERTVTDDLLSAQRELTIGHEFAELFLVQNRGRLSNYLMMMELEILDSFLNAYSAIEITAIETKEEMEGFTEPSTCKDAVIARWERLMTRYGMRLSQCLGRSDGYVE